MYRSSQQKCLFLVIRPKTGTLVYTKNLALPIWSVNHMKVQLGCYAYTMTMLVQGHLFRSSEGSYKYHLSWAPFLVNLRTQIFFLLQHYALYGEASYKGTTGVLFFRMHLVLLCDNVGSHETVLCIFIKHALHSISQRFLCRFCESNGGQTERSRSLWQGHLSSLGL